MRFPSPNGVRPLTRLLYLKNLTGCLFAFPSPNGVRPLTPKQGGYIMNNNMFPSPNGVRPLTLVRFFVKPDFTLGFPSPNGVRPLTQGEKILIRNMRISFRPLMG